MKYTYTSLLSQRQFSTLFFTQVATVLATSVTGLYLGTIVNDATGSPLLTSFAIFAPSLANIIGAAGFMSVADSGSPKRYMCWLQGAVAVCVAIQAFELPIWMRFVLLTAGGFATSISAGLRLGLISRTVGTDGYATARSLLNLTNGTMQVLGFAFGAVLIQVVPAETTFLVLGALLALGALLVLIGVQSRPAVPADSGLAGFARTRAVNAWAFRTPKVRTLLLMLWIPNGIVVGGESLFIPYAGENAGYLLSAGAAGMLLGDLAVGRLLSKRIRHLINIPQRLLLAAPYLLFFIEIPWAPAAVLVFTASLGFSASLGLQERLIAVTPEERAGQVQGLESSGRVAAQGVFALLAGATAEVLDPGFTISLFAALSLVITATLTLILRRHNGENEPSSLDGIDRSAHKLM